MVKTLRFIAVLQAGPDALSGIVHGRILGTDSTRILGCMVLALQSGHRIRIVREMHGYDSMRGTNWRVAGTVLELS